MLDRLLHVQGCGGFSTRGSSSKLLHVPGLQPSYVNLLQTAKASLRLLPPWHTTKHPP